LSLMIQSESDVGGGCTEQKMPNQQLYAFGFPFGSANRWTYGSGATHLHPNPAYGWTSYVREMAFTFTPPKNTIITTTNGADPQMPRRTKKPEKKLIDQYNHREASRANNPPVGLVTPETDRDAVKKTYAYDPHINPSLQFDPQRSQIEKIIDGALAAETLEDAKSALSELKKRQAPYLNWAGKAERTSFDIQTVSLHVHERIDPRIIIEAVRKRNGDEKQVSLPFGVGENWRVAVKIVEVTQ